MSKEEKVKNFISEKYGLTDNMSKEHLDWICKVVIEYANEQPYLPKFKYKFTFKDEQGLELVVYENTETKAFRKAFRTYEVPKDRELTIVKKEEILKQD